MLRGKVPALLQHLKAQWISDRGESLANEARADERWNSRDHNEYCAQSSLIFSPNEDFEPEEDYSSTGDKHSASKMWEYKCTPIRAIQESLWIQLIISKT